MKKIAFIVTYIGLLLPYRLRIYYGFLTNFILNSFKTNLLVAINLISKVIVGVLCIIVYFVGLPITALLKRFMEKDTLFIKSGYEESDILRRY